MTKVDGEKARQRARGKSWRHTDQAACELVQAAIKALEAGLLAANTTDGIEDLNGAITLIESAKALWS